MGTTLDISGLINSISEEHNASKQEGVSHEPSSISSRLKGSFIDPDSASLSKVAEEIEEELGVESLPLSRELEKVAGEMESAGSTDEIIKIAESLGNSDLAYISKIASSLADAIVADIENRLS